MSRNAIRAVELSGVINSPGWKVITAIAEQLVREAEAAVIACQDETLIISLQRKAQASREHWNELTRRISVGVNFEEDDDFQTVSN